MEFIICIVLIWVAFKFYMKQLLAKATAGDAKAQFAIFKIYIILRKQGKFERAMQFLSKSAEQGYAKAQSELGDRYQTGNGVEKNPALAVYWFKKAAAKGLPDAQYYLAICYQTGEGIEKDQDKAIELFEMSAAQNYRRSIFKFKEYKAESGDSGAQFDLGLQYLNSDKLPDARKWLEKAKINGISEAKFYLMICEAKEKGFKTDINGQTKFNEYERFAKQGSALFQYYLGCAYENCYISDNDDKKLKHFIEGMLEPDMIKACYWYKKSAEQGDNDAQLALAYHYLEGIGVDKDKKRALRLFYESAENGNELAQAYIPLLTGRSYEEFVLKNT